jgi:hypothetical protein
VVGYLGPASFAQVADRLRALHQGLKEAGYVAGENGAPHRQVNVREVLSWLFGSGP